MAKKGLKISDALRETQAFARARQTSKSWIRARRRKRVTVVEPGEEFAEFLRQYKSNRRVLVLENEDLRMSMGEFVTAG